VAIHAPPRLRGPCAGRRRAVHWHDRLAQGCCCCCAALVVFLLAPLATILVKSVQDKDGAFVGPAQFREYFATPALRSRSGTRCGWRRS
jgi:iron(III) transport system permease protein